MLPNLLNHEEMQAPIDAVNQKVSQIADDLFNTGLIQDKLEHRPFEYRLATKMAEYQNNHEK